jgi:hypothetical protein
MKHVIVMPLDILHSYPTVFKYDRDIVESHIHIVKTAGYGSVCFKITWPTLLTYLIFF